MQEGQILVGKYRVDRVLGVGGTGAVFAAHHLQLDTRVAIKFLRPSLLTNQDAVASFVREARAALQMHNEHVARVFDVGTLVTGAPYMVMEFLDGADLGMLLQKRGPLAVEEAVDFVLQACEGLAEAHALGIVHRDLKPTNLFCIRRPDGRPIIKVLDFGISEVMALGLPRDQTPTHGTALMGSPLYMAPEQLEPSQPVDARTDIWALGVILYELLSDRQPFSGETLPEVSSKISRLAPEPLRNLMPDVPDGLVAVIETCLQKERSRRYSSVAALARALLPFGPRRARVSVDRITDILQAAELSGLQTLTQPGSGSAAHPPMSPTATPPAPNHAPAALSQGARAGRPVMGLLAIAGVLGLVGAAVGAVTVALFSRTVIRGDDVPVSPADPGVPSGGAGRVVPPASSVAVAKPAPSLLPARAMAASRATTVPVVDAESRGRRAAARSAAALARAGSPSRAALPEPPGAVASSAGSAVDCNPAFELDDQGRKHFKAECLMGRTVSSPPGTRAAPPGCDPSFELDSQGRKHFKPECFLNAKR